MIRERMFLETMERVFGGIDKVIIDQNGRQSVVPYLPLNEMQRRPSRAAAGEPAPQRERRDEQLRPSHRPPGRGRARAIVL